MNAGIVLILVVMEDTLRARGGCYLDSEVLILVVMEDNSQRRKERPSTKRRRVLILVLMEDTLRGNETEGLVQYNVVS